VISTGMHAAAHTGAGDWLVQYPALAREHSRQRRLSGELAIVYVAGSCSPAIRRGDEVTMLDPRAIITDAASEHVDYGPSSIPAEQHSEEMAAWIEANPDWEREYAPGGVPKIPLQLPGDPPPNIVIGQNTYVAPRVGTRPRDGREIRRAVCGHDVCVSAQGIDATERRGKSLVCGPCAKALASEHGARFGVTDRPF
jgi:hypothetical protein